VRAPPRRLRAGRAARRTTCTVPRRPARRLPRAPSRRPAALPRPRARLLQRARPPRRHRCQPGDRRGRRPALHRDHRPALRPRRPGTIDTAFRVGSVTKLLTAALALDLADDHLLDLDAPLPALADHPDPRAAAITTRQLLTHTSGLPDLDPHAAADVPWRTALAARPLWTAPGALWSYSNAGYALVGEHLERLAHRPYPALLAERLLAPLHLAHTTADRDQALRDRAACGHLGRGPDAIALDVRQDLDIGARGATWTIPAGGVIASAPDLVALVLALADPTDSPLSPRAITTLLTADVPTHDHPGERQAPGLRVAPLPAGDRLYRLSGRTGDFTADLSFAPDRGFVLVLLTNTGDPLGATLAAAHDLLNHRPSAAPPATASHYTGRYLLPDRTEHRVTADPLALDGAPLIHLGDHRFRSESPPLTITFAFTADATHATHLRTRAWVATHAPHG
jgi:CubicO group peptidase (beta-lactamase class C family)